MASFENYSIFAPLPLTARGSVFHLNADAKNEKMVYCSGTAVVVRDLANPLNCYMYNEHAGNPTAAAFAPSGFYCASGDKYGKVRVWDTTQETHILKYEGEILGAPIKDIVWSPDSKRIIVVGQGQKRSHCFMWDSGTSCGNVTGHTKDVNAVAHSPARPFRAVTASEDFSLLFFHGAPYKREKSLRTHTNFVNSVRYSPTGATFASVSSDRKAVLYDGKTGDEIGEFKDGETAHSGGILAVSFSSAGDRLMTASADKTVKFWDVETRQVVSTFNAGSDLHDQQLGCLWAGEYVLSVSLSGNINYIDINSNSYARVLRGHQKSIETAVVKDNTIITSSFEGRITKWDAESGDASYFTGPGHKSKIVDCRVKEDTLVSVDIGNTVFRSSIASGEMGASSFSLPSSPKYFDLHETSGLEVYSCVNELVLIRDGNQVGSVKTTYQPNGVAIAPSGSVVAVGDDASPAIYLYDVEGDTLIQRQTLTSAGQSCTELAFSPDGAWLAAAGTQRKLFLFDVNKSYQLVNTAWSSSSRGSSCHFNPSSTLVAFGGIDSNVYICDVSKPMDSPIKIIRAHPQAPVTRVRWRNDNILVSTGNDFQVRQWKV